MAYDKALAALSDPTRRAVFEAVAKQPQSVGALAQGMPVSRPAVSQHLKVLSDAGLVEVSAKGTRRIYKLRVEGVAELRAYLDQFWDKVLLAFSEEVEKLEEGQSD